MESREDVMKIIYAKVGESLQQFGGECPTDWIEMQGERPTPEHIANNDGTWILPAPKQEEHEQIDSTMLDMAETIVALNDRLTKLEGGNK